MAILAMGGEMGFFTPSDSQCIERTTTNSYDTAFARCSVAPQGSTCYAETPDIASPPTTAFLHFELTISDGSAAGERTLLIWHDDSGTARIKLTHNPSTLDTKLYYDVGAGYVQAGSTIQLNLAISSPARQTIDLQAVVNSASGSLAMYVAGTERITSGTVDLSAITELNKARFYGFTFTSDVDTSIAYVSQCIIASESTIGMRIMTGYPSGNGVSTAWTGDYGAVDETVYSDADFISSSTNGQRETFAMTLVGGITGYSVRAVSVTARAKRGSSGPANIQLTTYTNSTNFDSSSIALGLGYSACVNVWEDNPDTTIDWTNAQASAIQFGVEANT